LTSTDLEVRITTKIDAEIEREGKTTLPGKKLLSLVSKFKDSLINLDCNENHHSDVTCGTASFRLLGLASDDFPLPVTFAPVRRFQIPQADLSRIINQISYAVSLDDSRKVLHGMLFSIKENTFTAVATDGKRLALVEKLLDSFSGEEGDCILPKKSADELKRLLGKENEVSVVIGENQILFESENSMMTSKLIEGNYPNYRQVIPPSFSKSVEVSTSEFIATLELVKIAISDSGNSFIKLSFLDNRLTFDAASSDVGEGSDYMDIDYTEAEINISFNPDFIADPFRHVQADKVNIKLNDSLSPVGIEGGEGFLYVIMPMRNK
jgi:DNA polymerase-3 subunit beta